MFSFHDHLKSVRKLHGVTQKQVANSLEITETLYQKYEHGKVKPSFDNLIAIADYFNVSLDYLVGLSDEPRTLRKDEEL